MKASIQDLCTPASAKQMGSKAETTRPTANFPPSIWGDRFLEYSSNLTETDVAMNQRHEELKESVRNMLVGNFDDYLHKLEFIDAIQRLGVEYHFKNETDTLLKEIYDNIDHTCYLKVIDDLYTVSLSFRLLREKGFQASSDVFRKFMDKNGKFEATLSSDMRGLLGLYEATYLRIRGEDILDEALEFTTNQLNIMLPSLKDHLKAQVSHALGQPIRTGLTRLEARTYLTFYENDIFHDKVLLEFARLDFNLLQKTHQKELSEIMRWWRDLDFAAKLPYARDRMVECYFWILGVYFEPEYSFARNIFSKITILSSTIDDTYDSYGTLEELVLFTNAIERWDIYAMAQLPEYMQILYKALLDVYVMIEEEMTRLGRSYRSCYAKEEMKRLVRAYFQEAKWCNAKYVPTFEEYTEVAYISGGYKTFATIAFVGMGDIVTEESFKWVSSDPLMVRASTVICRLMDDMASHKFEQEREHVASAVECYMIQHGVSEKRAILDLNKKVKDAWKDLNDECLSPTKVPMPLLTRILNLASVINVIYNGEDGYTNSTRIKDFVTSMLVDPVPM